MMKAQVSSKIEDLIERLGKSYEPALLPKDIRRGRLGNCFDECALASMNSRGQYRYVEGVAIAAMDNKPVLHAWLTDGKKAFDPTWRATDKTTDKDVAFPGVYFGIEMDIRLVMQFMLETGYQGVLANGHRSPQLIEKILGVVLA